MTTPVMIINFGPDPIKITTMTPSMNKNSYPEPEVIYVRGNHTEYVHGSQMLLVEEVDVEPVKDNT